MKFLVQIVRYFVAVVFIFSGFVKLVDPLGSAYKFQEYFGADVLNLEFLIPFALPFSIVLILVELLLGIFLLLGFKRKFTLWTLLVVILLFLFLTWYSAYYDKVTDCGCFGDAITLSPWETFYKNIVLGGLILFLLWKGNFINTLHSKAFATWVSFLSLFVSLYIVYHVLIHLPIIDFRPYAVGKNITEGMQYIDDKDPSIHNFYLESIEGEEMTDAILDMDKVLLVVAYNIKKGDERGFSRLAAVIQEAKKNGYDTYFLTASIRETYDMIQNEHGFNIPMLFCDETELKTIVRANPGLVLLQKGTVKDKRSWSDVDDLNF